LNPWEFWKKLGLLEEDQTHVFYRPSFLPKSCEHGGRKSKICVDLQTQGGWGGRGRSSLRVVKNKEEDDDDRVWGVLDFPTYLQAEKEIGRIMKPTRMKIM
jgi:hypothetical protein